VKKRERGFPYLAAAEESAGGSKPGLSPMPSVFSANGKAQLKGSPDRATLSRLDATGSGAQIAPIKE
jgi:hypothetical protein